MTTSITAAILVIGDEILSGRTKDKNIGYIAEYLTNLGIDLKEVRVVPDEEAEIVAAVNALRNRYAYLFTTGGIGPTHDDITADCVAKAFGVSIDHDERAIAMMLERYAREDLNEARLRMARIPAGAELIENPISKAPGFRQNIATVEQLRYPIAIILLTLSVMIILTPLTLKGTRSMMRMQRLQPEMKRLQKEYKDAGVEIGRVRKAEFSKIPWQDENGALTDDQFGYQRSLLVWEHLKDKGFIDKEGAVTSKFQPNQLGFSLDLPVDVAWAEGVVIELVERAHIGKYVKPISKRQPRVLNKHLYATTEFEEFWETISQKTTYRVRVNRDKIVKNAAKYPAPSR